MCILVTVRLSLEIAIQSKYPFQVSETKIGLCFSVAAAVKCSISSKPTSIHYSASIHVGTSENI